MEDKNNSEYYGNKKNVTVTEVAYGNTGHTPLTSVTPGKTWSFTLNNFTNDDVELLEKWSDDVNRMLISIETGESGTPHLQGFITFKTSKRLAGLKKLHAKAHWEKKIASDCYLYPRKFDSKVIIDINNDKQGQRSDLVRVAEQLKTKAISEVAIENPVEYIKFNRGMEKLKHIYNKKEKKEKPRVIYIWGPPGSGKTRKVYEENENAWFSNGDLKWFDDYEGQEVVCFDDLRGSNCRFSYLLRLLDRYPMNVEIKGGHANWNPKTIYITSCYPPDKLYSEELFDDENKIEQLLRRIDEIIHLE